VHAFVGSRLDSCNSLLAGVSSSARLVTEARRSEHMTPVLRDLHWLPVRQRITFKTTVLVYKCLHGMAPQYLQMHCVPTSTVTSRRLRSAHSGRLTVPRTRTNYGDRSFAVKGPWVWNSLPAELHTPDITLATFRIRLKTFLFYLLLLGLYPAHLQLLPDLALYVLNNNRRQIGTRMRSIEWCNL